MINFLAKISFYALEAVRLGLLLLVLLIIFGFLIPYTSHLNEYSYLHPLIKLDNIINNGIKYYFPTHFSGHDFSRLITIFMIVWISSIVQMLSDKLHTSIQLNKMHRELKNMELSHSTKISNNQIALFESKLHNASTISKKDRRALLKEFAEIKSELEKIGRDMAFLAIDVVDSTSLKENEDSQMVEMTFLEYHDFVENKLRQHGMIKASWTPDGVMSCFNTTNDAILAAQSVLDGLGYFNAHIKKIKKDFNIRCGINSGYVYYDDSIPLSQYSDRVLDIAGHMQKHAPINSILIAKQLITPTQAGKDFTLTEHLIDGLEVCSWINKKRN